MLQKIKDYALVAGSIILAILSFLFLRRGERIKDLQREAILRELDKKLTQLEEQNRMNEKEYEDALETYYRLRRHYDSLPGHPGRDPNQPKEQ